MGYGESLLRSIVVRGTSCRIPQSASSVAEVWTALNEQRDGVTEAPAARFEPRDVYTFTAQSIQE